MSWRAFIKDVRSKIALFDSLLEPIGSESANFGYDELLL